jgi:CHASE2 domain-containing sensor protein
MPRKEKHLAVLLTAAIGTILIVMAQFGWLDHPEGAYHDLWHQLTGVRYRPEHTVIVAIDDQTLKEHQDEPLVCWTPQGGHY